MLANINIDIDSDICESIFYAVFARSTFLRRGNLCVDAGFTDKGTRRDCRVITLRAKTAKAGANLQSLYLNLNIILDSSVVQSHLMPH